MDQRRLLEEIRQEVEARRDAGDFPRDLERDLDALFNRFAPPSASDDFDAVLERAENQTFIDYEVPLDSAKPIVPQVKRLLRKTMAWYVRYVAMQVSDFAGSIARSVRLLGRRVDRLEASAPAANTRLNDAYLSAPVPTTSLEMGNVVCEWLASTTGRVAVIECGEGELLNQMRDKGIDAYGVESRRNLAEKAAITAMDVRFDDPITHLEHVATEALGGLVLCGCVEYLPVGSQLQMLEIATDRLAESARLVVLVSGANRFRSVVEADLAPGAALHADTWKHLLEREGFINIEVRQLEDSSTDDRIARLERAVFGPPAYAILGVKTPRNR